MTLSKERELTPAEEDLGKTFTLTARLWETDEPEVFAEADCDLTVSDSMNPRFLNFEDVPNVNYDTNAGSIVAMRGMNWPTVLFAHGEPPGRPSRSSSVRPTWRFMFT